MLLFKCIIWAIYSNCQCSMKNKCLKSYHSSDLWKHLYAPNSSHVLFSNPARFSKPMAFKIAIYQNNKTDFDKNGRFSNNTDYWNEYEIKASHDKRYNKEKVTTKKSYPIQSTECHLKGEEMDWCFYDLHGCYIREIQNQGSRGFFV